MPVCGVLVRVFVCAGVFAPSHFCVCMLGDVYVHVCVRVWTWVCRHFTLYVCVCDYVQVSAYAEKAATRARLCSPVYFRSTGECALVSLFVRLSNPEPNAHDSALLFVREGTAIQAWLVPWRHARKENAGQDMFHELWLN